MLVSYKGKISFHYRYALVISVHTVYKWDALRASALVIQSRLDASVQWRVTTNSRLPADRLMEPRYHRCQLLRQFYGYDHLDRLTSLQIALRRRERMLDLANIHSPLVDATSGL
jgi:hypothetical protein